MAFWKKLFGKKDKNGKTVRAAYLANHGWYLSLARNRAVTNSGRSAAVLPYSLTDLLDERVYNAMTAYVRWDSHTYRYFHHRVHHVSSDHIVMHRVGDSRRGRFEHYDDSDPKQFESYVKAHLGRFQMMVLDGPGKREVLPSILQMLAKEGILIVPDDLMDVFDIDSVTEAMKKAGYKSLKFVNPAPLFHELSATLFYREGNCIGL